MKKKSTIKSNLKWIILALVIIVAAILLRMRVNVSADVTTLVKNYVWVTNANGASVTKLDMATGALLGTYTDGIVKPYNIASDSSGNVWVANGMGYTVAKLNGSTGAKFGTFTAGKAPIAVKIDSGGNAWVANNSANSVSKLKNTGELIGTYLVGTQPYDLAIDPSGNVWVANRLSNNVTKLSSSGSVLGTFPVGNGPYGIAADAAGNVWVTNNADNNVVKINSTTGAILAKYPTGSQPYGVTVDNVGNVWVVNTGSCQTVTSFTLFTDNTTETEINAASCHSVFKMNALTGKPISVTKTGFNAYGIGADSQGNIWVVISGSDAVTKISGSTGAIIGTYAVGSQPYGVAFSTENVTLSPAVKPMVTTGASTSTGSKATMAGLVTSRGAEVGGAIGIISEKGIYYWKDGGAVVTLKDMSTGLTISQTSGALEGVKYNYQAYAKNSAGQGVGAISTFVMAAGVVPVVSTSGYTLDGAKATMTGLVTSQGMEVGGASGVISEKGIYYWKDGGAVVTLNVASTGLTISQTSGALEGLKYYYQAYAKNSAGQGVGIISTFTVPAAIDPKVTTGTSTVVSTKATLSGTVTERGTTVGGAPCTITKKGINYWQWTGTKRELKDTANLNDNSINVITPELADGTYNYEAFMQNSASKDTVGTTLTFTIGTTIGGTGTSATYTPTSRQIRVIVSWTEGDKIKLQEFKTFMTGAAKLLPVVVNSNPAKFRLAVSNVGSGGIKSVDTNIDCGTTKCSYDYDPNTNVVLNANADSKWKFETWSGEGCSGTGICTVKMDANRTIQAIFAKIQYTLNLTQNGAGSVTHSTKETITSASGQTYTSKFDVGTQFDLVAAAAAGSTFTNWTGPGKGSCDTGSTCSIAMSDNKTIVANFNKIKYALSVTQAGTGTGSISSLPSGITTNNSSKTSSASFDSGTSVALTAILSSSTVAWTGCDSYNSVICTVSMSGIKSVTATLTSSPTPRILTVTKTGAGLGGVTSSPTGISIASTQSGDKTVSSSFTNNQSVVLTANVGINSHFHSWTGCDSVSTDNKCTVAMNNAKTVIINFGETTCSGVTVYYAINYSNGSKCMTAGDYNYAKLTSLGISNGMIKSIKVPAGHSVFVSEYTNFETINYWNAFSVTSLPDIRANQKIDHVDSMRVYNNTTGLPQTYTCLPRGVKGTQCF
jgi:DNA-binding beta-propeller fold protein YncE